jgi:hypothetical protein
VPALPCRALLMPCALASPLEVLLVPQRPDLPVLQAGRCCSADLQACLPLLLYRLTPCHIQVHLLLVQEQVCWQHQRQRQQLLQGRRLQLLRFGWVCNLRLLLLLRLHPATLECCCCCTRVLQAKRSHHLHPLLLLLLWYLLQLLLAVALPCLLSFSPGDLKHTKQRKPAAGGCVAIGGSISEHLCGFLGPGAAACHA